MSRFSVRRVRRAGAGERSRLTTLGFIGLGAMGGPMCRNLARRADFPVTVHDIDPEGPWPGGVREGVRCNRGDPARAARDCDIVFLSLPGAAEVRLVCLGGGRAAGPCAHRRRHRRLQHGFRWT